MAKKSEEEKLAKDRMVSLFRKKKLIIALIVLFLLLSLIVGIVTYYGLSTGGFTINVNDELNGVGIVLKEDPNAEGKQNLNATELKNVQPISQPEVNEYYVLNRNGEYTSNGGNYVGYTFYLSNVGGKVCDVSAALKIVTNTNDVASAARFWVFVSKGVETNDGTTTSFTPAQVDSKGTIYKKKESSEEKEKEYQNSIKNYGYKDCKDFTGEDSNIYTDKFLDFKPGDSYKISIILWLDGNDPDCVAYEDENGNSVGIYKGKLKIGMSFEANQEELL